MEKTINRNLLQYAAGHQMFCPRCKHVLDMRQTVSITLSATTIDTREFILCAACWDKVRLEMNDLAMGIKGDLAVLDGRDLWPPTLAQAKKICKALGVTLKYDSDLEEYNCNLAGGREATRYYTSDLNDAIGTARMMAKQKGGK